MKIKTKINGKNGGAQKPVRARKILSSLAFVILFALIVLFVIYGMPVLGLAPFGGTEGETTAATPPLTVTGDITSGADVSGADTSDAVPVAATTAAEPTSTVEPTKTDEPTSRIEPTAAPETTKTPETVKSPETTKTPETTAHVHTYGAWTTVIAPGCISDGRSKRTCSCGASETKVLPATGHTLVTLPAVAPTCYIEGKTEGSVCSACGAVFKAQTAIACLPHEAVDPEATLPVIGITFCDSASGTAMQAYINAVKAAGGTPLVIPYTGGVASAKKYADMCDGFIFSGGEDIAPGYYGEKVQSGAGVNVNSARDKFEMALFDLLRDDTRPILGICRGEQLINVYFGGTLYQNMPGHRQTSAGTNRPQRTEITTGSFLAGLVGNGVIYVNTFHHQAVKKVAPGFVASARTRDGYLEAIEPIDAGGRFILGVQWHPEQLYTVDQGSRNIFDAFITAARHAAAE